MTRYRESLVQHRWKSGGKPDDRFTMDHSGGRRQMRKWISGFAGLGAVAMLAATPAAAQISYYTQGYFTSPSFAPCNQVAPAPGAPAGAVCSGGGFTLTYTPTLAVSVAPGSITSLGQFTLTGQGDVEVLPGVVDFTILVQQTNPTLGTGTFAGAITGSVTTAPGGNFSSLMWTPNQTETIGPVTYTMIFDNIGPAANVGLGIPINNQRGIDVLPTVVPEPGSMALLATGLVGILGGAVRSRRKSKGGKTA